MQPLAPAAPLGPIETQQGCKQFRDEKGVSISLATLVKSVPG